MEVISYMKGIPAGNKNPEKEQVLRFFAHGASAGGDNGIQSQSDRWVPSDVGVIQGYVHESSPNSPHLRLRKSVIDNQKKAGKHTVIIDSNLFLYVDKTNRQHYLRYSLDGVFPTTGNYFWDNPDPKRWESISRNLGLRLQPEKTKGHHILICLQRNGGWSMKGLDVMKWLFQTIQVLRMYTDRPILVRGHPGDKRAKQYLKINKPGVVVSTNPDIRTDFVNCHAVVTYNSSPGVAAAIEGLPVFVLDNTPQISQAYDIANTDITKIEKPDFFDRQAWIEKISMSHWNFAELQSGQAWKHMRQFIT
jgi:hypothetical protein